MRQATLLVVLCLLFATIPAEAQGDGSPLTGTINDNTPVYEIPLTITAPNSLFVADIRPTSGDLDTLLLLVDAEGNVVAENDDRAQGDASSLLAYPNAEQGQYTLIATRYKAQEGSSAGDFELQTVIRDPLQLAGDYVVTPEALAAAGFPAIEPHPVAEWTILVYYGADTNLEPGIMNDFNEFEIAGGSNEQVRVVSLMDRTPGYADGSGDWRSARLFEISPDGSSDESTVYPPTLDTDELAELGEVNMGEGQTLAQFLTWAITHYPAQHYAVTFGSHGAGWQGLITDETDSNDILSIPELDAAFKAAQTATGVEKLDLLVNDACLMSSIEYYTTMSQYFDVSYASPEIILDPALDMSLLTSLLNAGSSDLKDVGTILVDTYLERDIAATGVAISPYLSNAVSDLTAHNALTAATEAFATVVNGDPARYAVWLGQARANTYTYTAFLGEASYIDMGHFMRQVLAISDDAELNAAAQAVLDALVPVKLYGNAGAEVASKTSYYNIYFPDDSRNFSLSYLLESPLTEWSKMLRAYYNAVTPRSWTLGTGVPLDAGLVSAVVPEETPEPPQPPAAPALTFHAPRAPEVRLSSVYPTVANTLNPVMIQMEIIGRGIASGTFTADRVLENGSRVRLAKSPIYTEVLVDGELDWINQWDAGVDVGTFEWDATLTVVSDGTQFENEYVVDGDNTSSLEGRYREPGGTAWQAVSVIFNDAGETQRVISRVEGSDALGTVRIPAGSEFQALRQHVTPDGRTVTEPGNTYLWPAGGLELFWDPAPSGIYEVGILVTGFGGTTGFDSVQVTINNDEVDWDISGYTDIDWGLTVQYGIEWVAPGYYADEDYIYSYHESGDAEFYLLPLDTDAIDAETIAEEFLASDWVEDSYGELYATQIDGLPAYAFAFDYLSDAGELWPAWGAAVYNVHTDLPIVFFVTGTLDQAEMEAAFYRLHDEMLLFKVDDTRQWTVGWITDTARYPVLKAWSETEDDFGLCYTPPTGEANVLAGVSAWDVFDTSSAELADELFAEFVMPDTIDLTAGEALTYRSETFTWTVLPYTAKRDGAAITGRLYATVQAAEGFGLWFEAPVDSAPSLFADVFELMLDGFRLDTVE